MSSGPYSQEREIVNLVTQETRFYIFQYILAHPENLPSLLELDYVVPKSQSTIKEHLDVLIEEDLVGKYSIEETARDQPSTFYGLTSEGILTLKDIGMLGGKQFLQSLYSRMDKPKKVKKYQNASRPGKKSFDPKVSRKSESSYPDEYPDLIEEALEMSQNERDSASEDQTVEEDLTEISPSNIETAVVGCGGAGNNTINRVEEIGITGMETIAINTDRQHLKMVSADDKFLIGKETLDGLGAGGDPQAAREAIMPEKSKLRKYFSNKKLVFVTAGLGGGTGTGILPTVAEVAQESSAVVVGIASTPFNVERARKEKAKDGLQELVEFTDSVILLDNNRLLDKIPDLPIGKAFSVMDQIIAETLKGLFGSMNGSSLVNLDFADVQTVFKHGDISVVAIGESIDRESSEQIVDRGVNHPLLDVDINEATSGLVHITGGPDLSLEESQKIIEEILDDMRSSPRIIWGASVQAEFKGKIRVLSIFSGYSCAEALDALDWNEIHQVAISDLDIDNSNWKNGRHAQI